jgi:hypothetical protein
VSIELISTNVTPPPVVGLGGGEGDGDEDDWNQGEAYALMKDTKDTDARSGGTSGTKKARSHVRSESFDDEKGRLMLPEDDVHVTVVSRDGRNR